MPTELTEQGTLHLALAVGPSAQGTALTRILALKSSPGWLVRGQTAVEWRFEGVTERDGQTYLIGPHVKGMTLEGVLGMTLEAGLPYVARLADGLRSLQQAGVPWFALDAGGVVFDQTDGVLFLPPRVCAEIRDVRPFAVNRDSFEVLNHPDLKGESLASFSLASMLYRLATGRFAFAGTDAEEIHEQARKLVLTPPGRVVPSLLPEISTLVMAGLGRAKRGAVTLAEWEKEIALWGQSGLFRALSEGEKKKMQLEGEAHASGSAKSFRRRMFLEKNWKLILIVGVAVLAAAFAVNGIVRNATAPRLTAGYEPYKIVTLFYTSMNTLDHATMEACVVGRAGQGEINAATTLYVTSRVVLGYEGKSNIVSAQEWDAAGRPDLTSPASLYGVTGLELTEEQPKPAPVFLVKYQKWNPAQEGNPTGLAPADAIQQTEGNEITERVWLRQDKGDWVIYKIDRIQSDPLTPPRTVAAPAPSDTVAPKIQF